METLGPQVRPSLPLRTDTISQADPAAVQRIAEAARAMGISAHRLARTDGFVACSLQRSLSKSTAKSTVPPHATSAITVAMPLSAGPSKPQLDDRWALETAIHAANAAEVVAHFKSRKAASSESQVRVSCSPPFWINALSQDDKLLYALGMHAPSLDSAFTMIDQLEAEGLCTQVCRSRRSPHCTAIRL